MIDIGFMDVIKSENVEFINLNNAILTILFNGVVGGVVYFISCKIFKIEELDEVINMMKNRVYK